MTEFAYIHIPFCISKCKYCSFVSYTDTELMKAYVYSLLKEIETNYENEKLKTLYIGGGTPSLLPVEFFEKILRKFEFEENPEITIEVNPCDITKNYLNDLHKLGINRVSVGIQSFNDDTLKLIGRRHNSVQAINALQLLTDSGFKNFSADLIYGLPSQNIELFKYDLEKLLTFNPPHISLYGLKIEDGCYFSKNLPKDLPDDDNQADMYLYAVDFLKNSSYEHYEISNFSKVGFESKHNLNYWNNKNYYGFGVAAHGYIDGIRYYNTSDIRKYIEQPTFHEYGKELSDEEKLQEEIFLGFRKSTGISVKDINERYNFDFEKKYSKILKKYINDGFIEKTKCAYKLTLKGVLLSNLILADFL